MGKKYQNYAVSVYLSFLFMSIWALLPDMNE